MTRCFLMTETGRERRFLRRYRSGAGSCPGGHGYHDAQVLIGEFDVERTPDGYIEHPQPDRNDPRFPSKCEHCDYTFTDEDHFQLTGDELYSTQDGRVLTKRDKVPGAMYFAWWYFDPEDEKDIGDLPAMIERAQRPDYQGVLSVHYLTTWARKRAPIMVICPNGSHWCVDSKSSNGTGWVVEGDAPLLKCSPSIDTRNGYHGFLGTNGAEPGYFTANL